jgi:hypothetical protein
MAVMVYKVQLQEHLLIMQVAEERVATMVLVVELVDQAAEEMQEHPQQLEQLVRLVLLILVAVVVEMALAQVPQQTAVMAEAE